MDKIASEFGNKSDGNSSLPPRASTQTLLDLASREQVALVVFGHAGEQWRSLKKAPEYDG